MKVRPIIFNADMVRAVLNGSKTQTRRIIKNQRVGDGWSGKPAQNPRSKGHSHDWWFPTGIQLYSALPACPFGAVGDRLWVRETWNDVNSERASAVAYRADEGLCCLADDDEDKDDPRLEKWLKRGELQLTPQYLSSAKDRTHRFLRGTQTN